MPKFKGYKQEDVAQKSMHNSVIEGTFVASAASMTTDYIVPYAIHLNASNAEIGILSSLQNLANTFSQVAGIKFIESYSRKAILIATQLLVRLIWIPVILLALLPANQIVFLIALLAVTAFLSGIKNLSWTSLMGDVVPENIRGTFFGKRNMIIGLASLFGTLASGLILTLFGFGILFGLSVILGLISIKYTMKITEPPSITHYHYKHRFEFNVKEWPIFVRTHRNFVIFTIYAVIISFAIALVAPFYTVYMLRNLDIGYLWYAVIITTWAVVNIFSQPYWGKIYDRIGDKTILVTGAMVPIIPLLWIFANNIPMLLFIHIYDAFIFGGFSLILFNFLLSLTPQNDRSAFIANHTFFVGLSTFGGTLTGGFLAQSLQNATFMGLQGLLILFFISFLIRLSTLLLLPKVHSSYTGHVEHEPLNHLFWRVLVADPTKGFARVVGHIYDIAWLENKLRQLGTWIKENTIYRIKLYSTHPEKSLKK